MREIYVALYIILVLLYGDVPFTFKVRNNQVDGYWSNVAPVCSGESVCSVCSYSTVQLQS